MVWSCSKAFSILSLGMRPIVYLRMAKVGERLALVLGASLAIEMLNSMRPEMRAPELVTSSRRAAR
jgi:hypothetical protein